MELLAASVPTVNWLESLIEMAKLTGTTFSNSRTQFVIVEFGTTTRAGKAFHLSMMLPKNVTIWTVFPCRIAEQFAKRNKEIFYQTHFVSENAVLQSPPIVAKPVETINLVDNS